MELELNEGKKDAKKYVSVVHGKGLHYFSIIFYQLSSWATLEVQVPLENSLILCSYD